MTDLDIDDFNGYRDKISDVLKIMSGEMTDRELVDMEAGLG